MNGGLAFYRRFIERHGLCLFFSIGALHVPSVTAGGMLTGTKMIFYAHERSVSTLVSNINDQDCTVRVWVSDREADNSLSAPFIAMPALFMVQPGAEQVLRVIRTPGELPKDRESVFYLNAQKIPLVQLSQGDASKIAATERIEMFYRPDNLSGKTADAAAQLRWQLIAEGGLHQLRVTNPSAYYVTLVGVKVASGHKVYELGELGMLAPKSTQDYSLGNRVVAQQLDVEFSVVNDDGGYTKSMRSKGYL